MSRFRDVSSLLLLLAALGLGPAASGARAAAPVTWSEPMPLRAPFTAGDDLSDVSCADLSHCFVASAGVASTGAAYSSADFGHSWALTSAAMRPAGGSGPLSCAPDPTGTAPFCLRLTAGFGVEDLTAGPGPPAPAGATVPDAISALSCPTATFCVGVGGSSTQGAVDVSDTPLTGTWSSRPVDPGHALVAVSCADASLCVAVDDSGAILTSTAPATTAWTRSQLAAPVTAVSCPSDLLCVAVSSAGEVFTYSAAADGAWTPSTLAAGTPLLGVSCPTTGFCTISADSGAVFASTSPAAGAYGQVATLPAGLGAITCPSAAACMVLDGAGVISSATVLAGSGSWHALDGRTTSMDAIACPSAELCVAMEKTGGADVSTTPTADRAWRHLDPDPHGSIMGLSCPSVHACYAVDHAGRLLWTTHPAVGGWKSTRIPTRLGPIAISCPSAGFCAVADADGGVLSSSDPRGGPARWRRVELEKPFNSHGATVTLKTLSCPSTGFCLSSDNNGHVLTSTSPAAGARASWKATRIWPRHTEPYTALPAADCVSARFCVVMATSHRTGTVALVSTRPTAGAHAWTRHRVDPGWARTATSLAEPGLAVGLSCPGTRFCAMVDDLGTAVTSTAPASARWLSASVDTLADPDFWSGRPGFSAISCFAANRCVAVDNFGNRFVFGVGAGQLVPTPRLGYGA